MDDFIDSAEMVGVGSESAEQALASMNKVVGEAALGIGRGKIILEKLGIAAKDAAGKVRPVTEVMGDLQSKLATMDRGQAMAIMEKLGLDPQLLRMFNGELGNLQKIQEEMATTDKSVGLDFDQAVEESKAFQASMISMKTEARLLWHWFTTLWESLAVKLMPKVRAGLDRVGKVFEELRHKLQENGKKIVEAISPILNVILRVGESFVAFVARTIGVISNLIGRVVGAFMAMNEASNGWIGYLAIALAAWKAFNLGFLLTPLGAILGLSVAILALYDDFMTWKEGGDSLIDWSKWAPGIEAGLGAINSFIDAVVTLAGAVGDLIGAFVKLFSGNFAGFFTQFAEFGQGLINTFKQLWDMVVGLDGAFSKIATVTAGIFGGSIATPSPQARVAVSGGANVNQATNIHVAGGANPQATAQAVAAKQKEVNASMTRNVRGATR
ncbi:MAG: hypothetical protein LUQ28_12070 [Methylococcaceae bacterium]|nr:hypothetical protein [Methylococcaceae bacterium]